MLPADLDHQYYVVAPWATWYDFDEIQSRIGRTRLGFVDPDGDRVAPIAELLRGPQGGGILVANVPAFENWFGIVGIIPHSNYLTPRGIGETKYRKFPAEVRTPEPVPGWLKPFGPEPKRPLKSSVTPEHVAGLKSPHWLFDCGLRCKSAKLLPVLHQVGDWVDIKLQEVEFSGIRLPQATPWQLPAENQWLAFELEITDQPLGLLYAATIYAAMCASLIRGSKIRAVHLAAEIESEPGFRSTWTSFR